MLFPILTESRFLSDLNGIWDFKPDNGSGFSERWYERPLENPMTMPVPAAYNDIKDSKELRDHYGWVFYQRRVAIPKNFSADRVLLRFDAVTHVAKVYIDGEFICEHKGGFLPFEVEIGDKLCGGDHLLTVAVDNVIDFSTLPVGGKANILGGGLGAMMGMSMPVSDKKVNNPNFDFFNYAGIIRSVHIYTTPKDYIKDVTVVSTINGKNATLCYDLQGVGNGESRVEVYEKSGKLVAQASGNEGEIIIKDAHLWEPGEGYLYNIKFYFAEDTYTLPYGIRTVEVKDKKFLINGKPFYFKGYGKHEDTFPAGRGMNLPMNTKDISLIKWQGANSFRTSHYPYSEEMMRQCDEEGIVVIDETPAVGINLGFGGGANITGDSTGTFDPVHGVHTFEHHKDVIRDLIARDKNHACVVMWSIANEPDSSRKRGAYDYFRPLFDLAREEDPQKRPCTLVSVMSVTPDDDVTAELSDVICLNRYYGWYLLAEDMGMAEKVLRMELDAWTRIGKPVCFTEYGADTVSGFHDTVPVMYTEEFQLDYYKMYSKVFDEYPIVIGEQVWNFADFATSQGLLRVQGNKKGLFTRDRKPKLAAHYFKDRWNSIPNFEYK